MSKKRWAQILAFSGILFLSLNVLLPTFSKRVNINALNEIAAMDMIDRMRFESLMYKSGKVKATMFDGREMSGEHIPAEYANDIFNDLYAKLLNELNTRAENNLRSFSRNFYEPGYIFEDEGLIIDRVAYMSDDRGTILVCGIRMSGVSNRGSGICESNRGALYRLILWR